MWYVIFLFIVFFIAIGAVFMTDIASILNFPLGKYEWFQNFLVFWRYTARPCIIILDILLIFCILYVFTKVWPLRHKIKLFHWLKEEREKVVYVDKKFVSQWQKVKNKLSLPTPSNLKLAIIEADALVDNFLKKAGYAGDYMAERLSHVISDVKSLNGVWDAHILRNGLVHVSGSAVSETEAKIAVMAFENFLKELGALPEK